MQSHPRAASAFITFIILSGAGQAFAQIPPGVDPGQVEKKIQEYLEALPKGKLELEGIDLVYRKIPSDPVEVVNRVVDERWRELVKEYVSTVESKLHSFLEEAGTLETRREITVKKKKKKVPAGKYTFGIFLDKGVPVYVGISGKGLEDPIRIPFRTRKGLPQLEELKIEGKIKRKKLELVIAYGRYAAKLPPLPLGKVEAEAAGEETEGQAGDGTDGSGGTGAQTGRGS